MLLGDIKKKKNKKSSDVVDELGSFCGTPLVAHNVSSRGDDEEKRFISGRRRH